MPGTRLGTYEIVSAIGAGGMGEVYRAIDSNLKRSVAIKVLPAAMAGDADRLARFQREAEVLAALNHSNIAAIYGLEKTPDLTALVMELVEGEDLSALIARGPIALSDALPIARQIAEALEAAHEQGIVHRDLKPANIKVRADGAVKVLDFGLAKAMDPPGPSSGGAMNSPTMTARATQMGMIIGTAAYMSPEQAKGQTVDKRADIWAYGVVVYEMLTGTRTFKGDDVSDTLASVLKDTPDFSGLPPATPPHVRRLIERCLERDPKRRLRDIGEARLAIDEVLMGKTSTPVAAIPAAVRSPAPWRRLLPWALVVALAGVAAALLLRQPLASASNQLVRSDISLPADVEFYSGPSISADGTKFFFVGVRQGVRQIYLRSLDADDMRPLAGTESAVVLAVSPNGQSVAFTTTDLRLKRLTVATGIVDVILVGSDLVSSLAWAGDASIIFTRSGRVMLRAVSGGAERELAVPDAAVGESLAAPMPTDDGALVLFTARRVSTGVVQTRIEAVPIGGGPRRVLIDGGDQIVSIMGNRLLFRQGDALFTVGFDSAQMSLRGTRTRLGESVGMTTLTGLASVSVARNGTLLSAPTSILNGHLVWVSAAGVERVVPGAARAFQNPRVSPAGRSIAFSDSGAIWTLDPDRGTFARVSKGSDPIIGYPAWSIDGTRIYYRSADGVKVARADGEGAPALLPNTSSNDFPSSLTPDGQRLAMLRLMPETGGDVVMMPVEGGKSTAVVATPAFESGPQVSPDGKWLLYVSDESGRMEIYLRPMSGPDRKWPVSNDGGLHPLWSRDGRQVFYRSGQRMLAVDVTTAPDVHLGTPHVLFERRYTFGPNITFPNYSLSADGRDFLMVQDEPGGRHFNLVLNWRQNLDR